ncbi:UNVERIFIED_CONTAM: hypothetical protein GTU68_022399 [Idotea baltica]|nr:hypothetical protein [Idotea baltica]
MFAVILTSLLLIPSPICAMWISLSVGSIMTGVIGYGFLWGMTLDVTSLMALLISIGLSAHYSVHVTYSFLTTKVQTTERRLAESLFSMGLPIVQGGLATLIGILPFAFLPSEMFRTFFKIIFLETFFGMMHGVLVLSVLLSLLGPGSVTQDGKRPLLTDIRHIPL